MDSSTSWTNQRVNVSFSKLVGTSKASLDQGSRQVLFGNPKSRMCTRRISEYRSRACAFAPRQSVKAKATLRHAQTQINVVHDKDRDTCRTNLKIECSMLVTAPWNSCILESTPTRSNESHRCESIFLLGDK
jgi:hypothetical protein